MSGGKQILYTVLRILGRVLLVILTAAAALTVSTYVILHTVFNGPSPTARDMLVLSLSESESTSWIPGIFLDDALIQQIQAGAESELSADITDPSMVTVGSNASSFSDTTNGIRIETRNGSTYTAHILLVQHPSQILLGTAASADSLLNSEGALAAVTAGISGSGYAGFNADGILMVAHYMTDTYAAALGIQDGCSSGPALIINGQVNLSVYNSDSGLNSRTAIGQRADGSVILLCAEGHELSAMGATYQDLIDILVEYGAVNACAMGSGSSCTMLYRETLSGKTETISPNAMFSSEDASSFWMVLPAGEE